MKAMSFAILVLSCATLVHGSEPAVGGLLQRSPWVRFELAGGRIVVANLAAAPNRTLNAENAAASESLTINSTSEEGALRYEYKSPESSFALQYVAPGVLTLRSSTGNGTVELLQRPNELLEVKIAVAGSRERVIKSNDLWQLILFCPDTRKHLLPQLLALNPGWDFEREAAETKAALLKAASSNWQHDRAQWQENVQQLSDADYAVRQSADRELRGSGVAATGYLATLDPADFDPEQAKRIGRILEAARHRPDEPATVAARLLFDTKAWCAMLSDSSPQVRLVAAEHLEQLLGRPIRFEASATVSVRKAQVRVLEDTLVR